MLHKKSLADPFFGRPGRVDLLLGVVHTNQCSTTHVVASEDRRFRATDTIFWLVIKGGSNIRGTAEPPKVCVWAEV